MKPTPTAKQAEQAMADYAKATSEIASIDATQKTAIANLQKLDMDKKNKLSTKAAEAYAILQSYAECNGHLFEEKKSIPLPGGTIGYRSGQTAVKEMEGFTMKDIVAKVRKLLPEFLKVEASLNMAVIKSKLDEKGVVAKLEKCGLEVLPGEEKFYVKVA